MSIPMILAAAALTVSSTAQATTNCIPQQEAEALFLALAPGVIGTTATICAANLPPSALLRSRVGQLTAKYAPEGEAAWPRAKAALKRITGPDAEPMLESDLARPMLISLVAPMLTKEVKASDCPNIDRILTLMDPLSARNTAALVVTILELSQRDKPARPGRAFTICPIEAAKR